MHRESKDQKAEVDGENSRANLHTLHQLINFLFRHLLAQLCEDVSQLSSADEAIALLVKHLEATNKFLC